jgi:integrase
VPRIVSNQLSAVKVGALAKAAKPGHYADGGGLYLQISKFGTAAWTVRYRAGGRLREMGLGSVNVVGLAEARQRAAKVREQLFLGHDPVEQRRANQRAAQVEAAKAATFKDCAEGYIAAHSPVWRNSKHAAQWGATLATYVFSVFGDLPVQAVDTALVMKAIEPIWTEKAETASRVRGRIEAILDWARVRGYRDGENPARWRGHLENLLAAPSKAKRAVRQRKGLGEHFEALPYGRIAGFIAELREQEGIAARALEFAILTAARTGEVIGARWDEIDTAQSLWTIPAGRMKAGKEHRVPLSDAAMAIVEKMAEVRSGDFVFPGGRAGRPLSNMALLMALRRMDHAGLTAHGFRSTFRDWAAERTNFPAEVAEMALAHAVGDKVEAAYRRGDLFDKRRQIMDAWAKFCAAPPAAGASVVELRQGRRA